MYTIKIYVKRLFTGVFDQPRAPQFSGAKRPADAGVRVADLQHGRRVRQAKTVKQSNSGGRLVAQAQSMVSVT